MFPLAGKDFPSTSDQLAKSIHDALARLLSLSNNNSIVQAEGGDFPTIAKLKVDLDGASVTSKALPPKPRPVGVRRPGIAVEDLEVLARPIKYKTSKLDFTVKAKDVRFDFGRDKEGNPLLVLTAARQGHVTACISKQELQALLLAVAHEVGEQQKLKIQDLKLDLSQKGPRLIAADVQITGKKLLMTSTLEFQAELEIDDELIATLRNLDASGEGVVGSMVSKVIRSKLKPYEGQKFPLVAFSLGDIALRDLSIAVKNDVQVSADFGSDAG